jgi:hypothetical protein
MAVSGIKVRLWHFSEVAPVAFGGRSRFQKRTLTTVYLHVYEYTP